MSRLRARLDRVAARAEPRPRLTAAEGERARHELADRMARTAAAAEAGDTEAAARLERIRAALTRATEGRA